MPSLTITAQPGALSGVYTPPGDKSISHRAVMFGSLAEGTSSYTGFLQSGDCLHTLEAFRKLGVSIDLDAGSGRVTIQGAGMRGLREPKEEIYLGNSGTSMRLMMGILAGQRMQAVLSGDASLSTRPMRRVTDPLKRMGAQIKGKDQGNFAPLTIRGARLKGIEYDNVLGSAQVKSAILLGGMQAEGITRIRESRFSRDHTERFLKAAGARFRRSGEYLEVEKTETLRAMNGRIPGDFSSAAFFIAAAARVPGAELEVKNVSLNPTRTGLLRVLERMGAVITEHPEESSPEPVGTLRITGSVLHGTRIVKDEIPSLIDELPVLMMVMSLAEGESLVSGAEELRVKETDRITSMVSNLRALGGDLEELPDGCVIRGVERLHGGKVRSFDDHRTVMSLVTATLAMKTGDVLEIDDTRCVATSYPAFFEDFRRLTGKSRKSR